MKKRPAEYRTCLAVDDGRGGLRCATARLILPRPAHAIHPIPCNPIPSSPTPSPRRRRRRRRRLELRPGQARAGRPGQQLPQRCRASLARWPPPTCPMASGDPLEMRRGWVCEPLFPGPETACAA